MFDVFEPDNYNKLYKSKQQRLLWDKKKKHVNSNTVNYIRLSIITFFIF